MPRASKKESKMTIKNIFVQSSEKVEKSCDWRSREKNKRSYERDSTGKEYICI